MTQLNYFSSFCRNIFDIAEDSAQDTLLTDDSIETLTDEATEIQDDTVETPEIVKIQRRRRRCT